MTKLFTEEHTHKNLIQFTQFLQIPELKHGFTTRHGGVSHGFFSSFNLGFGRGDEHALVMKNYTLLAEILGLDVKDFVLSKQVHGDKILPCDL
jgi:polyphenol oxidase